MLMRWPWTVWEVASCVGGDAEKLTIARRHADVLQAAAHSGSLPWFQVQRAKIVLAIAAGERQCSVAGRLECDEATVWRASHVIARGAWRVCSPTAGKVIRAARSRFPPCNGHKS